MARQAGCPPALKPQFIFHALGLTSKQKETNQKIRKAGVQGYHIILYAGDGSGNDNRMCLAKLRKWTSLYNKLVCKVNSSVVQAVFG